MGGVRVDTTGLQALVAHAERLASELIGSNRPVAGGNCWQASVAAVGAVDALTSSAAGTFAARMSTTAERLAAGSFGYASQDDRGASGIRTVTL